MLNGRLLCDSAKPCFARIPLATYGEHEAIVDIRQLRVVRGQRLRRGLALVLEWAVANRESLTENARRDVRRGGVAGAVSYSSGGEQLIQSSQDVSLALVQAVLGEELREQVRHGDVVHVSEGDMRVALEAGVGQ